MHRLSLIILAVWLAGCSTLGVLGPLEQGRAAQLAGDPEASRKAFDKAMAQIRQDDDRALISASGTALTGAALLSNDNVRRYRVAPFERLFLHPYQALNYLALGKPESALVEMRRADAWQRRQMLAHEDEVRKAEAASREQGIAVQHADSVLGPLDAAAARVKSSVQHAGALYLGGLLYEASGGMDDALIDYREALRLVPDHPAIRADVERLSAPGGRAARSGQGDLVVYWENGLAPRKTAFQLPVITSKALTLVTVPFFPDPLGPPSPQSFRVDGAPRVARPIVDTQALAARVLREQMPGILLRTTLRTIAKQKLQRELQEQSAGLGVVGALYSLISEQADLRSWQNLPDSVSLDRVSLPAGSHRIDLPGGAPVTVEIVPGRIVLLHVVTSPQVHHTRIYPL